jgi:DNA (cytosine-5)-methyltransferase 1
MKVLDLCSGIGGFSLGLTRAGMRTTAFCEIEKYPRSILRKHWPHVPIFEDLRELYAKDLPEAVDLICGGFPCQPFSLAGQRKGADDDRHLWPEIMRIIRELDATTGKPAWCIFENVPGLISMGLDTVLSDLENEAYAAWPFVVPACAVNAPHRRDRVWIVANHAGWINREHHAGTMQRQKPQFGKGVGVDDVSDSPRQLLNGRSNSGEAGRDELADSRCAAADTDAKHGDIPRLRAGKISQQQEAGVQQNIIADSEGRTMRNVGKDIGETSGEINTLINTSCIVGGDDRDKRTIVTNSKSKQARGVFKPWFSSYIESGSDWRGQAGEWITMPGVRARDDGLSDRVARLKALGNAVVPQIPELIGKIIMEIESK